MISYFESTVNYLLNVAQNNCYGNDTAFCYLCEIFLKLLNVAVYIRVRVYFRKKK
jgi:hypothetical protein